MMRVYIWVGVAVLGWLSTPGVAGEGQYLVDSTGQLGRHFDGIGGLSGGGATSKLLVNYEETLRSRILDYLFKPNFGASLQILKVEIGGDGQSTEGTESSHMHEVWDEAYDRGYEWWLMQEAKKRNPDIKLFGLPWAFPGWISNGTHNPFIAPYRTADYISRWVQGAKTHYNLTIDYLGVWNEKGYNKDYTRALRETLNQRGLSHVKLELADGGLKQIVHDVLNDKEFAKIVDYIGVHYPGTKTNNDSLLTGKPLWSSEDNSTPDNNVGGGCWARTLNQNYVNGYMTSTINWNLIASYYPNLPWGYCGLMTAQEPWSGHYTVSSPIWVTAHTTQFSAIGWRYLQHGLGVGHLDRGGSYVSLTDPSKTHLTIVIETMSHDHSICTRPPLPKYDIAPQTATFTIKSTKPVRHLYVWRSRLRFDGQPDDMFRLIGWVKVEEGKVTLSLGVDELYTLTTVTRQPPKLYPDPPQSRPFPLPYTEDFQAYPINGEAYNFVPQVGVWEVRRSKDRGHDKIYRQVMLNKPCYWCDIGFSPINLGGNFNWSDVRLQMDVSVPSVNGTAGVTLAARIAKGGCSKWKPHVYEGVFFTMFVGTRNISISSDRDLTNRVYNGTWGQIMKTDKWYHLDFNLKGNKLVVKINNKKVLAINTPSLPTNGYVGFGAATYGLADYDNLEVSAASDFSDMKSPNYYNYGDVKDFQKL